MEPVKTTLTPSLPQMPGALGKISPQRPDLESTKGNAGSEKATPFADLLESRLGPMAKAPAAQELRFSAHARSRLNSRSIDLSPQDLVKMQEAVNRANEKGSRESLILTDKAAFVVSVKNNTVITAVDRDSLKDNIFTNIDSTVMI